MKLFRTYLIADLNEVRKITSKELGGARFVLKPEPTNTFWESKDGKSSSQFSTPRELDTVQEDEILQKEFVIESETEELAEDLLSVVHGGMLLAYPEPSLTSNLFFVSEVKEEYEKFFRQLPFTNRFKKLENIGFGCIVANQLFKDKKAVYAIEKYKVSLELASFRPHSIDPRYGQYFEHYDLKRQFHTRAAFAITSAFSVIEELGLEVRSSAQKPRFKNKVTGEWNPIVLKDIISRLKNANIESDKTFDWVYRGTETRIEQEIKPFFGFDSVWTTYGEEVRDKTLTYPEAIHNASYLRNFITSHKFNELTQFISPYDVYNVQALARNLILLKYKLWDVMMEKNSS